MYEKSNKNVSEAIFWYTTWGVKGGGVRLDYFGAFGMDSVVLDVWVLGLEDGCGA